LADPKHRTDNGRLSDVLSDPTRQALVVKFLESIDFNTVPFVSMTVRREGQQIFVAFDSVLGARYALEVAELIVGPYAVTGTAIVGTGARIEVPLPIGSSTDFVRVVAAP